MDAALRSPEDVDAALRSPEDEKLKFGDFRGCKNRGF
jgi:hypothetical protein